MTEAPVTMTDFVRARAGTLRPPLYQNWPTTLGDLLPHIQGIPPNLEQENPEVEHATSAVDALLAPSGGTTRCGMRTFSPFFFPFAGFQAPKRVGKRDSCVSKLQQTIFFGQETNTIKASGLFTPNSSPSHKSQPSPLR